ncbi:MAG TPA: histidinol-phosphate transaminase [Chthoniobacterales bacterium]
MLFTLPAMRSIWELANSQLKDLVVYEPGKPIEETARELRVDPASITKLASNENALGPSPAAIAAMRSVLRDVHLYPDGSGFYLRQAIADRVQLARENVILGNGSNEIIEFLGHAFLSRGDSIVVSQYAFIAYKLIATLFDARTIETPSRDYCHDLDAMAGSATPNTRLILIANPNNPTGTLASQSEIDRFMDEVPENIVTVFDEAYYEFLDNPPDTIRYVRENRNVIVLRTFSKIHGLAGLRIGYGIAPTPLIEVLQKTREPFNVTGIGQTGALAALTDKDHQQRSKHTVDIGRAYFADEFNGLGLKFLPGVANFLMVNVGDGPRIFKEMLTRGVIVRPLVGYGLREWVRISVGTMEQNEKCTSALKQILTKTAIV